MKNVISQGDFAFWPQLSLIIFLVTFIAIIAWAYRRKARHHYDTMAKLVMEDQTRENRHE